MATEQTVKFGFAQTTNPTPKGLKIFFRIWSFAAAVAGIIIANYPAMPDHIKVHILTAFTTGTTIIHFGIKMFGLQDTAA